MWFADESDWQEYMDHMTEACMLIEKGLIHQEFPEERASVAAFIEVMKHFALVAHGRLGLSDTELGAAFLYVATYAHEMNEPITYSDPDFAHEYAPWMAPTCHEPPEGTWKWQ